MGDIAGDPSRLIAREQPERIDPSKQKSHCLGLRNSASSLSAEGFMFRLDLNGTGGNSDE
jgi:hypothetical protein